MSLYPLPHVGNVRGLVQRTMSSACRSKCLPVIYGAGMVLNIDLLTGWSRGRLVENRGWGNKSPIPHVWCSVRRAAQCEYQDCCYRQSCAKFVPELFPKRMISFKDDKSIRI